MLLLKSSRLFLNFSKLIRVKFWKKLKKQPTVSTILLTRSKRYQIPSSYGSIVGSHNIYQLYKSPQ